MMKLNNFLTEESIKILKEEIEYRKVILRHKILEDVKEARAHGDLSENFEYKAAKRERGRNESRIRYLEKMIKTANIIVDNTSKDEVGLNKEVDIKFLQDGEVGRFKIVTTIEADPLSNKISIESPLGSVIYKHKVGEVLTVTSPEGQYTVRIEGIHI